MIHLTLNQISAYIDAELPEASVELVRLHLSSCLECTERFGQIEEQEEALSRLLVSDPGDGFFADFSERVLGPRPVPPEPKRAAEPVRVPEPRKEAPPAEPPRAPASPRALEAPRAVETPRPVERPRAVEPPRTVEPPRVSEPRAVETSGMPPVSAPASFPTARQKKPRKARVLIPVAALLLVASGIAVLTLRSGSSGSLLDFLSNRGEGARPGVTATEPNPSSAGATSKAPAGREQEAPLPAGDAGALERAAAKTAEAERLGTGLAYDDAAAAWTAALPQLEADPEELAAGRREIASARVAAWVAAPSVERRALAMEAVRAYLLCAPAGAQRDLAWSWLARLKR